MKNATKSASGSIFSLVLVVLVTWSATFPVRVAAQNGSQGQNAVYNSNNQPVGSSAFIDASMFAFQNGTICSVVYTILKQPTYSASVIDARGLLNSTPPTSLTCASGWTLWNNGTTFQNKPSTILLPAGTIVIPTKWVLPSSTHLIGEGSTISAGFTPGTTLQVSSSFATNTPMIQFGSSSGCCSAISVEQLALDGNGAFVNGVENQYAGDLSYVDHLALVRILGTGLWVHGTANNSGPYFGVNCL